MNQDFEPSTGSVIVEGAFATIHTTLDDYGHFSVDGLTASGHRLESGALLPSGASHPDAGP